MRHDIAAPYALHADRKFIANDSWMKWQGTSVLAIHCNDDKWRVFACAGCPPLYTPSPEFDSADELMQWLKLVSASEGKAT